MGVSGVGGGRQVEPDMCMPDVDDEPTGSAEGTGESAQTAATSQAAWSEHASDVGAALMARDVGGTIEGVAEAGGSVLDSIGGWFEDRADDVRDAGQTLSEAADDVRDFVSEDIPATFERAASYAEESASTVAGFLGDLGEGIGSAWRDVRDVGENLIREGGEVIDAAGRGLEELGEGAAELAREGLEAARSAGETILEVGRDIVGTVVDQLDVGKQIGELNSDGDKVVYELGAMVQAEVRGEAAGRVEVERQGDGPDATYEVTVSGDVGIGIVGQLGGSAGGRASAEANAMLRGGGSVVMTFNSAEEAERAVEVMARQAAVTAAGNAVGGPLGGMAANALAGPSDEDLQFLSDHTTAIELRGGISAEVSGSLGIGLDDGALRLAGVGASLGGEATMGARLILPRDGNPAQLQVFAEGTLEGEASASVGLEETGGDERGGSLGVGAGAGGNVTARIEATYDLPRDIDVGALVRDPNGTLAGYADQMRQSETVKLTLGGEVSAQATGAGGGTLGVEVEVSGRSQDIQRALDAATRGGFDAGLRALDPALTVEAKTTSTRTHGFRLSPEISAFGVGVGVTVAAERNDQTVTGTASAPPSEIYAWLERQLEDQRRAGIRP